MELIHKLYSQTAIGQQVVAQLWQVSWGHNIAIMFKNQNKLPSIEHIERELTALGVAE